MITNQITAICAEYARLECAARELAARKAQGWWGPRSDGYPQIFRSAAKLLYIRAPANARPHLNVVMRVLKLDTTVTNPQSVLNLAAVIKRMEDRRA